MRERWHNQLDPNIRKDPWTLDEDRRLLLHFFGWLRHAKGVAEPSFNLFTSPKMGAVAQAFAEAHTWSAGAPYGSRAWRLVV